MVVGVGRRLARLLVVVGLMGAMLLPVVGSAGSWSVSRLSGSDRFGTAVAVSQEMYPSGADRVYVAYGYGFPDALAAGGGLPGPVLLTRQDSVPGSVVAEIQRLDPAEVFIVGGPGVIDPAVVSQLTNAAPPTTTTTTTTTTVPALTERKILEALYNATDGDNWNTNTGWLSAGDACDWYGITCVNGDVAGISLNSNNLVGTIPSELGNLTNLTALSLSSNQLSGAIPAGLGNLTNLTNLWLYGNQLSGAIPSELGNLTNLTNLYLSDNQLTGTVPTAFKDLDSLQYLVLRNNDLSGVLPDQLLELQDTVTLLELYGQSGCLTAASPGLATWLGSLDTNWNDGCP